MPKKNILVLASTFPRWKNDTTPRFVYDLSKRLALDHKITILAPHYPGAKKYDQSEGLEIKRFSYFYPESMQKLCYDGGIIPNMKKSALAKLQLPFFVMSEFITALMAIHKKRYALIHAHWIIPQGYIGALLKKFHKIPLIVTIHGSDLFPLKNSFLKYFQKFTLQQADYITVNSQATYNELISRFGNSIKAKIIPMGVNIHQYKRRDIKRPKKYMGAKILLFVGRLSEQKGVQYLIDAMPKVLKYYRNAKLLIIGDGPFKDELKNLIHAKKLEDNIEFLGPMRSDQVSKFYNYSDVFILPSLKHSSGTEALGLSLLEAMSSGCPVIGSDSGGIPYIISNNKTGIIVKQKNSNELAFAILKLFKDRKKSKKLSIQAEKFVRNNYSWSIISKKFLSIYDGLLK
jgi:glycosyltransferase involved in cell wall biosynthesis